MSSRRSTIRADLADAVHDNVGLPRAECAELIDDVFKTMADSLSAGESVKISTFGTFNVRSKSERTGRNPKTGEEAVITPRRVVTFKASNLLKSKVESRPLDRS